MFPYLSTAGCIGRRGHGVFKAIYLVRESFRSSLLICSSIALSLGKVEKLCLVFWDVWWIKKLFQTSDVYHTTFGCDVWVWYVWVCRLKAQVKGKGFPFPDTNGGLFFPIPCSMHYTVNSLYLVHSIAPSFFTKNRGVCKSNWYNYFCYTVTQLTHRARDHLWHHSRFFPPDYLKCFSNYTVKI